MTGTKLMLLSIGVFSLAITASCAIGGGGTGVDRGIGVGGPSCVKVLSSGPCIDGGTTGIHDPTDDSALLAAHRIVEEFESGQSRQPIEDQLQVLQLLHNKYPRNRQVLLTLGIAQFETRRFKDAVGTFTTMTTHYPNEFPSHYNLGISLKKQADHLEEQEIQNQRLFIPYCGSATSPWAEVHHTPSKQIVTLRERAKQELEQSLTYYAEPKIGRADYGGYRIARNLGWLYYQLSEGCQNKELCAQAISWHENALRGTSQFRGYPQYVLALNNLGEIYRTLHDNQKSYSYLWQGVNSHQAMLANNDPDAKNRDYRCVYYVLAEFYLLDQREAESLHVIRKGKREFEYQSLDPKLERLIGLVVEDLLPSENYEKLIVDGQTINARTSQMLSTAQKRCSGLSGPWKITQGSYTGEVKNSAETHSGGGVIDLSVRDSTGTVFSKDTISKIVSCLRMSGFAAWYRNPGEVYPNSPPHIHAVAVGDRDLSSTAKAQVLNYLSGQRGLKSGKQDLHGGPVLVGWFFDLIRLGENGYDNEFVRAINFAIRSKKAGALGI